jgi:antirestriction protein ArdC
MKTEQLLEQVNNQILEMMQTNGTEWARPWAQKIANGAHYNVISKKPYSGINTFITAFTPYSAPIWGTYKQWSEKGAQVKKGEKATHIFYMAPFTPKDATTRGDGTKRTAFVTKCYAVFNAEQVDGFDIPAAGEFVAPDIASTINEVELFVQQTNAIINKTGETAFYSPANDCIQIPEINRFFSAEGYYGTLLHELTHWTGSEKRCNRKFSTRFGSEDYAREELVAEIGSAQLCALLNITSEPRTDHAKYINSWMQVIKDDNKAMMKAFSQAGKAVNYLLATQNMTAIAA